MIIFGVIAICPKTITLQHHIFWIIRFWEPQRKDYVRDVLELFLGTLILIGDLSDFRTVWQIGPLGELISGAVM